MADFALKIAEIGRLKKIITFFEKKLPKNLHNQQMLITFVVFLRTRVHSLIV